LFGGMDFRRCGAQSMQEAGSTSAKYGLKKESQDRYVGVSLFAGALFNCWINWLPAPLDV
jgi:hypothetical protein